MATELKLEGAQADYTLQTVPTPDGAQVVLFGASAATQGDVHELKGVQTLLFADGKVDLFLSSLAQSQSQQQTPNQPNTSITQRLVQWVCVTEKSFCNPKPRAISQWVCAFIRHLCGQVLPKSPLTVA